MTRNVTHTKTSATYFDFEKGGDFTKGKFLKDSAQADDCWDTRHTSQSEAYNVEAYKAINVDQKHHAKCIGSVLQKKKIIYIYTHTHTEAAVMTGVANPRPILALSTFKYIDRQIDRQIDA